MDLNELAICVIDSLLEKSGLCRAGAHHGICRTAENGADAAGTKDYSIGSERFHFHGAQIHRADTTADSGVVQHGR